MDLHLGTSILLSSILFSIGFIVLAKNYRNKLNVYFFGFSTLLSLWVLSNYYSNDFTLSHELALLSNHLVLFFSAASLVFLMRFTAIIASHNIRYLNTLTSIVIIGSILGLTPLVIVDIYEQQGVYAIEFGLLASMYFASIFTSILVSLWQLIIGYIKNEGIVRARIVIVLLSLAIMTILSVITNALIPILTGSFALTNLGPFATIFLALGMAYVIVKHRLFDIRLVIARSIAYVLVIATLGLTYGLIVFNIVDRFFPGTQTTTLQQAIYTLLAVFLAFTFQPIKRFFDKLTNRIFYRDRYDTEEVLNSLGKIFVSKSNSFELLDESLQVIKDTLKVEFGRLVVLGKDGIYKSTHIGSHEDIEVNTDSLNRFTEQISILDEIENDNDNIKGALKDMRAYALVRLSTQDGLIGYMILGSKSSGTIYTQQDINMLEILSQELAVAIQNAKSYEEIQAFSETLKQEVEDATAKLRETNERLIKLDEAKDEFISMASHQLRTPLTTVKGYLSMLLEGDAGKLSKKQHEFVDLSFVSSKRMVHLIADMLNVSRISTGKLMIDKTEVDMLELVQEEVDQLKRQAEARNVKLILHKPKSKLPKLSLDETKIRQVVMNFTDNAIYYSPEGKVDIYLENKDDSVEFRVVDNGIGVSKEAQKELFKKFFRAENAKTVRPDGTGLGLYMAKQVIELQGGEIIFESQEGKGSTFGFRFNTNDN